LPNRVIPAGGKAGQGIGPGDGVSWSGVGHGVKLSIVGAASTLAWPGSRGRRVHFTFLGSPLNLNLAPNPRAGGE
jgi:hypothetical protein